MLDVLEETGTCNPMLLLGCRIWSGEILIPQTPIPRISREYGPPSAGVDSPLAPTSAIGQR